ncbi:MAG TPA: leucyl aminopeptidase [Pinirhizobacter sp.]|uniref:leucyl aminopeptidase n=1 Tax=Pinirhizobacter sp. TaxID=2950432 RepID=UPI002C97F063|nr:leucyl aminopeptidase [Pinirhizobacter sp.]HMH68562.1 leucyl aminopeptidase [Pinirhizobacter sp.]
MTLQFSLGSGLPDASPTPCAVVGVFEHGVLTSAAARLDVACGGAVKRMVESGDITGKAGTAVVLFAPVDAPAERVVVVGLGAQKGFDAQRYQKVCLEAARAVGRLPVESAVVHLAEIDVPGRDIAWRTRTAALAFDHAAYRYTATFKPKDAKKTPELVAVTITAEAAGERGLVEAAAIATGTRLARELGNLPPNICNPAYLADQAREFADRRVNVECEVLERDEMEKLGFGSLLAVARGSANAPKLIVLQYHGGAEGEKPYAFVGKGITFDTGGISLKPGAGMEEMKFDMCGAAGVLGAFVATVELGLPVNLVCVVPAVENMPDGSAYRPGDVLTSLSGLTIEVLNTDAEGRLILCDALTYTGDRFDPAVIIDAATLTGACVVALGKHATGVMSKHDDLAAEIIAAGEATLDRGWRLPLWDEYQSGLESGFADVANIGGKFGGAITAGCFLARFTEGRRWAHLDIAGTAWDEGRKGLATGRPVPMLVQWLIHRAGQA